MRTAKLGIIDNNGDIFRFLQAFGATLDTYGITFYEELGLVQINGFYVQGEPVLARIPLPVEEHGFVQINGLDVQGEPVVARIPLPVWNDLCKMDEALNRSSGLNGIDSLHP